MKPILFNTEMVLAILNGRKTVTRRVVKPKYRNNERGWRVNHRVIDDVITGLEYTDEDRCGTDRYIQPPYQPGDILYVKETFSPIYENEVSNKVVGYLYKADPTGKEAVKEYDKKYPNGEDYTWDGRWHPSIHMPKEAARNFLKVTDVRVERLGDMTVSDAVKEGINTNRIITNQGIIEYRAWNRMGELWDSTIKKQDLDKYG